MSPEPDPQDLRWTSLDVRRLVLAQLFVLVLALVTAFFVGVYSELRVLVSESAPTPFTCAEYAPEADAPRWVRLRDCYVDPETALVERGGLLRLVALHDTPDFREDATLMLATRRPPSSVGPHTFEGVVVSRTELSINRRIRVYDSDLDGIDRDFWTLRQDERPSVSGVVSLVLVWLLCAVLGYAAVRKQIVWRAQRKRWEAEQRARTG